ncbi:MAG: sulfatase [Verrucomicrobiales bacterium]|nr:sulfatase [Verrucomicrobiales bacterium]
MPVLFGEERPNLLFIYLDDFGWKDTGFMGSDFYETPNLDALAEEGMVFTNAYSASANCAPARASLLSGQYTPRHKIYNVGTGPRGKAKHRRLLHVPGVDVLDPSITTWANCIQEAGYLTATMGKWHLSDDPLPYGFEVNVAGTHSGGPPAGYYPPHPKVPGLGDYSDDEYLTDTLSDRAEQFVRENRESPWMLYLTHFAVHTPLNPKKEYVEKYENKEPGELHDHVAMATMIQSVDEGVGRIVKALEETGTRENTIIVFFSDNGGYGPATDMAPLKGYKGTYYEGGIRVPFFVNWPGVVEGGTTNDSPIIGVDLFPTFCEMLDVEGPEGQILDGVSLMPLLKGGASEVTDRALFWHFPAYLQSFGKGAAPEQRDPLFRSRPCSVIRKGDWKLLEFYESGEFELYDLKTDIGEEDDLSGTEVEKLELLKSDLDGWRKETGADIPTELNPEFDHDSEKKAIRKAMARG